MGIFGKNKTSDKPGEEKKKEKEAEKKPGGSSLSDKRGKKQSMKDLYSGTGEKAVKDKSAGKMKTDKNNKAYKTLIKPLITEKAANLAAENKYVFTVDKSANKIEIAKAISALYGVWPESVNTVKNKGKKVRYGRHFGKRKDWKKAVVTLPKGSSINIYEGV